MRNRVITENPNCLEASFPRQNCNEMGIYVFPILKLVYVPGNLSDKIKYPQELVGLETPDLFLAAKLFFFRHGQPIRDDFQSCLLPLFMGSIHPILC